MSNNYVALSWQALFFEAPNQKFQFYLQRAFYLRVHSMIYLAQWSMLSTIFCRFLHQQKQPNIQTILICCLFNISTPAKSNQNNQEDRCTVIFPLKLVLSASSLKIPSIITSLSKPNLVIVYCAANNKMYIPETFILYRYKSVFPLRLNLSRRGCRLLYDSTPASLFVTSSTISITSCP